MSLKVTSHLHLLLLLLFFLHCCWRSAAWCCMSCPALLLYRLLISHTTPGPRDARLLINWTAISQHHPLTSQAGIRPLVDHTEGGQPLLALVPDSLCVYGLLAPAIFRVCRQALWFQVVVLGENRLSRVVCSLNRKFRIWIFNKCLSSVERLYSGRRSTALVKTSGVTGSKESASGLRCELAATMLCRRFLW